MPSDSSARRGEQPDYSVEIDADELLSEVADMAADYGESYEDHRREIDELAPFPDARGWMLEARGGQRALSDVLSVLQPQSHHWRSVRIRNDDGTVDVRELLRWLSRQSEEAYERRDGPGRTPQASEAESAYCAVISLIRDDYGVGWPRIDDIGGVMERDLP